VSSFLIHDNVPEERRHFKPDWAVHGDGFIESLDPCNSASSMCHCGGGNCLGEDKEEDEAACDRLHVVDRKGLIGGSSKEDVSRPEEARKM
jgi:hypothetical protein